MEIKLDLLQTVGLAVCVFLLGRWIKSKVKFFQKYFIPAPVIGGLIASVVIFAALKQGWFTKNYSDEGIVFIVWDFTDEFNPKIMVRTWQPMEIDDKDVFTLNNFKLN